jgi:hypothetical protein
MRKSWGVLTSSMALKPSHEKISLRLAGTARESTDGRRWLTSEDVGAAAGSGDKGAAKDAESWRGAGVAVRPGVGSESDRRWRRDSCRSPRWPARRGSGWPGGGAARL